MDVVGDGKREAKEKGRGRGAEEEQHVTNLARHFFMAEVQRRRVLEAPLVSHSHKRKSQVRVAK
jgi:hypothetical protein